MDGEWVEYDGGVVQDWHRRARRIRVAPGVAVIPERAFRGCTSLRAVDISNVSTISDSAFISCISLEQVVWTIASEVEIGKRAFYGCSSLREINLSNVTKIGAGAFEYCVALKRVSIQSSVAAIEDGAFKDCTDLMDAELGDGIQRIGERAFYDCSALVRINIPASVTDVGDDAFNSCSRLEEVVLNKGLQQVGDRAFHECTSLLRINIPSTTLKVGPGAFALCDQLRHAELREGLQTIGRGAFWQCRLLERITIPSSVTLVGAGAFQYCGSFREVTLCEGVHCIEGEAFDECTSLEHINIPPVAFAIDIERSSCQLTRTTTPKPLGRKLVVSKWMQYRSPEQLAQAEAKVNEILSRNGLTEEEQIQSIREWFAYYDRLDATTLLELAIWGSNMDGNERGAEARQVRRRNCGNDLNVIIPGVLPFLDERGGGEMTPMTNDDEDA